MEITLELRTCVFLVKSKKLQKSYLRIDQNWARIDFGTKRQKIVFGMRNEKSKTPWIAISMG